MTSTVALAVLAALAAACGGTTLTEVGGPGGVRCQTSLGTQPPTVGSGGGEFAVPVVAARDCLWTTTSEAAWLQVSPAQGQGEGDLVLQVAANQQTQPRTGAFVLNDARVTVTQEAAALPPLPPPFPQPPAGGSRCEYAIDPGTAQFGPSGGEGRVQVAAGVGCLWVATSSPGWITILEGTIGIGPGEVRYRVSPFGGRERTGTIVIAGRVHTVTQRRDD